MEHYVTAMGCHLPYGITQCYLPGCHPTHVNRPRLNPSQASARSTYSRASQRDRRLSWSRCLVTQLITDTLLFLLKLWCLFKKLCYLKKIYVNLLFVYFIICFYSLRCCIWVKVRDGHLACIMPGASNSKNIIFGRLGIICSNFCENCLVKPKFKNVLIRLKLTAS